MYEHRSAPLLPRQLFVRRVVNHAIIGASILAASLLVGVVGYRLIANLPWIDAFLEASMILGGMGPIHELTTGGAKLFAGCYALYSGVVFLGAIGLVVAPIAHRLIHTLHLDRK